MLQGLERASNTTFTENGAVTNRSSGSYCLDFFAVCGALRQASRRHIYRLFVRAFAENRDLAMRALFYARDIRGGIGERDVFRDIIMLLAWKRPASVKKNIPLIPEYGRWDDLIVLLNTPCEDDAIDCIRDQLNRDLSALEKGDQVSLMAKWLPSVNTSSAQRRAEARLLCRRLGMPEKEYRRTLAKLRARVDVLERRLCDVDYSFDYSKQPSGAMRRYRKAFHRHDHDRYVDWIDRVVRGEARMHADTLFPYEIIRECLSFNDTWDDSPQSGEEEAENELIRSIDASWKSLPDYGDSRNALAVIDGSGSMFWVGNPMPAEVAISLGIYFAEHNTGFFRDHFITFSHTPRLVKLEGDNIVDRTLYCMSFDEAANTNLRAVFTLILKAAIDNHLPQEEMPETIYIISDMEFDEGVEPDMTLYQEIKALFTHYGYRLPTLVYWNVSCRSEQSPVCMDEHGTVLVSGASPSLFQMVIGQNVSPEQFMLSVLNRERYRRISA